MLSCSIYFWKDDPIQEDCGHQPPSGWTSKSLISGKRNILSCIVFSILFKFWEYLITDFIYTVLIYSSFLFSWKKLLPNLNIWMEWSKLSTNFLLQNEDSIIINLMGAPRISEFLCGHCNSPLFCVCSWGKKHAFKN